MMVAHVIHYFTMSLRVIAQSHFYLVSLGLRAFIRIFGTIMDCKLSGIDIAEVHYMPAEIRMSAATHPPRGRTVDRSGGEG
jgi:hypothetical protein